MYSTQEPICMQYSVNNYGVQIIIEHFVNPISISTDCSTEHNDFYLVVEKL